jgi:Fic family protein
MSKNIEVWSPISINEKWLLSDVSVFDDLAPSWYKKREEFEKNQDIFDEFLTKLKRQHAIETGVIEKLYDLSDGITQTLIKNGFVESDIGHNDANIPPKKLMKYLRDHFDAMDFIFYLVKSNRNLTISFILELHQLITQNQDYTEAVNSLGQIVNVKLLKGKFKENENNPKREDGTVFLYCPPIFVNQEMDNLISIYNELTKNNTNPIILASWMHHSFTQIHPFQDGNGRIARLLSSLILIKNGLLPFTVKREDKVKYINALENADFGNPQDLVTFFARE